MRITSPTKPATHTHNQERTDTSHVKSPGISWTSPALGRFRRTRPDGSGEQHHGVLHVLARVPLERDDEVAAGSQLRVIGHPTTRARPRSGWSVIFAGVLVLVVLARRPSARVSMEASSNAPRRYRAADACIGRPADLLVQRRAVTVSCHRRLGGRHRRRLRPGPGHSRCSALWLGLLRGHMPPR